MPYRTKNPGQAEADDLNSAAQGQPGRNSDGYSSNTPIKGRGTYGDPYTVADTDTISRSIHDFKSDPDHHSVKAHYHDQ